MISRLKRKGYSPAARERTVEYLEENNYINDEEFVRLFLELSFEKDWGPVRIDFNLKRLGVSTGLRKKVLKENSDCSRRVREIIERKLENYKKIKPLPEPKIWQKIIMHLMRKGFTSKVINQEMSKLGVNEFEGK